jgi:hypothetical protein
MQEAFAVEFDLTTPIIMDRGINLAGLLARLLAEVGEPDPLSKVPLASTDGVFAGSDLFILGPVLDYPITYVRSLRPSAMDDDIALHDRRHRKLDQITLRDERKNLLDRRLATSAPTLLAFGTGGIAEVQLLLDGLAHIGAKRSGGYGTISTIRISNIDHPHAGLADRQGNPMRAVPITVWRGMNLPPRPVRNLVARLPRWAAPREPCVGPRNWVIEADALDQEIGA